MVSGHPHSLFVRTQMRLVSDVADAYRGHIQGLVMNHPEEHIRRVYTRVVGDARVRDAHDVKCTLLPYPPGVPMRDVCRPVRFTFRFKNLAMGTPKNAIGAVSVHRCPIDMLLLRCTLPDTERVEW